MWSPTVQTPPCQTLVRMQKFNFGAPHRPNRRACFPFQSFFAVRIVNNSWPPHIIPISACTCLVCGTLSGLSVLLPVAPQWPMGVRPLVSLLGSVLQWQFPAGPTLSGCTGRPPRAAWPGVPLWKEGLSSGNGPHLGSLSYLSVLIFGTLHSDGYLSPFSFAFCFSSFLSYL